MLASLAQRAPEVPAIAPRRAARYRFVIFVGGPPDDPPWSEGQRLLETAPGSLW
jgi:hypothetical protein